MEWQRGRALKRMNGNSPLLPRPLHAEQSCIRGGMYGAEKGDLKDQEPLPHLRIEQYPAQLRRAHGIADALVSGAKTVTIRTLEWMEKLSENMEREVHISFLYYV